MGFSKFSQSDYYFSKHPLRCNKKIPKTKNTRHLEISYGAARVKLATREPQLRHRAKPISLQILFLSPPTNFTCLLK